MLLILLKYQIRSVFFLTLITALFASLIESYLSIVIAPMVLILHPKLFYNAYSSMLISIIQIRISNIKPSKILALHNLSLLIWFTFWYLLGKLLALFVLHTSLSTELFHYLAFTCCLLLSFTVGNHLSNSDLFTYKFPFMRLLTLTLAFAFCLTFLLSIILIISAYHHKLLTITLLLPVFLGIWYFGLRRLKEITYFKFLVRNND